MHPVQAPGISPPSRASLRVVKASEDQEGSVMGLPLSFGYSLR